MPGIYSAIRSVSTKSLSFKKHRIYFLLFFCSLLSSIEFANAQNRNTTVTILNNYAEYNNANIDAFHSLLSHFDNYNSIFNGYVKRKEKLGGEKYSKEPNPFLDADMFYLHEDDPGYLYSKTLKESAALPPAVRTDLNNSMKAVQKCSERILVIYDSLSLIFSGNMIDVEKDSTKLPYRLLFDAKRQLTISKQHRDELFFKLNLYYEKLCPLTVASTDYLNSVKPLKKGMSICQKIMTDLSRNDSSQLAKHIHSLDSLTTYLDHSELSLLKGIRPLGNSKMFPNKNVSNGFDLYSKYENINDAFKNFAKRNRRFLLQFNQTQKSNSWKYFVFHEDLSSYFNSNGLLQYFNEYCILIGGGKLAVDADLISSYKRIYKGWGDGKDALPQRYLLLWFKETPQYEIDWSY